MELPVSFTSVNCHGEAHSIHPVKLPRWGMKLIVVILEMNKDERKLSLGHKQIEEDPWDTFESVFPIGSEHQATVGKKDDKAATILLPYGLEAYANVKNLRKEDWQVC